MGVIHYGWAESTPAMRALFAAGSGAMRRVKRRAKRAASKVARKVKRKASARGVAARFVKGSPAAKRHMAKLRKLAARARKRG